MVIHGEDHETRLPRPPEPLGRYRMAARSGDLLFLSGMLPICDGMPEFRGRLGAELDIEAGRSAARLAARNGLAVARRHLTTLDRVESVVRLTVHLATTPEFEAHAQVADAASEVFHDALGPRGGHSRLALGAASLPGGMPVELEVILAVKSQ